MSYVPMTLFFCVGYSIDHALAINIRREAAINQIG